MSNNIKCWSIEVVGNSITGQNYTKCDIHSHFWRFWLVKIAHMTLIWMKIYILELSKLK